MTGDIPSLQGTKQSGRICCKSFC